MHSNKKQKSDSVAAAGSNFPDNPAEPGLASRRILVADDDPVALQFTLGMLERLGCRADAAVNGRQAISLHGAQAYDLVLMDCQMPELDGYAATGRIRALEAGGPHRTPIIALTAYTDRNEQKKCLAAGMDDFISKPVHLHLLEEVLGHWLLPVATAPDDRKDELEAVHMIFGADFAELSALYRTDSPNRIALLHEARAAGDHQRIAKVAHAFSGSCASIGADHLSTLCRELELLAQRGVTDSIDEKLDAIELEYARVAAKLRSLTGAP